MPKAESLSFMVYVKELGSSFVSAKTSVNFTFSSSVAPASWAHKLNALRFRLFLSRCAMNFL